MFPDLTERDGSEVKDTDQHTETVCPFPLEYWTVISGFSPICTLCTLNYSCDFGTDTGESHVCWGSAVSVLCNHVSGCSVKCGNGCRNRENDCTLEFELQWLSLHSLCTYQRLGLIRSTLYPLHVKVFVIFSLFHVRSYCVSILVLLSTQLTAINCNSKCPCVCTPSWK